MYKAYALAIALGAIIGTSWSAMRVTPFGPDAGFLYRGQYVQFEHIGCLADPHAIWWEDGSAVCGDAAKNWAQ